MKKVKFISRKIRNKIFANKTASFEEIIKRAHSQYKMYNRRVKLQ